jgi:hypothetical protein
MKKIFSFVLGVLIISIVTGTSNEDVSGNLTSQSVESGNVRGNKLSQLINEKKQQKEFRNVSLFKYELESADNYNSASFVSKANVLKIRHEAVDALLRKKDENIVFRIPLSEDNTLELELTRSYPVSDDFVLSAKDGTGSRIKSYTPGLHYRGIIKGRENSIASVSIFKEFVMGIISDERGNFVLGSIKNSDKIYSDNYIFYNDADLKVKNDFKCGVDGNEEKFIRDMNESNMSLDRNGSQNSVNRLPVKVYFEADYQMFLHAGSNVQTLASFITGMFNSVATIYQNESIPFELSQVSYWSSPDPYMNMTDSYQILINFGANTRDNYQANLAHLISTRNAGLGGIAWIRVMCAGYNAADSAGRFAFSNIEPNYEDFPTYSWTVNVVAHEMGHSLGSRHTHSCIWPIGPGGAIRAIDSCYDAEGGCFSNNQRRPRVGTIMSYCHLWPVNQGGGINLALGFGQLPGDTIRLRYAQAGCLDRLMNSSEVPSTFDLDQNFPNPFNPVTKIRFALPADSRISIKIFDITGRLITGLIDNKFFAPGFYDVEFNSAAFELSSGIYFYSLVSDGKLIDTKRMVLIK